MKCWTKTRKETVKCECGKQHTWTFYEVADITDNEKLRRSILNGNVFDDTCPHCHKTTRRTYALDVYDGNSKMYVKSGKINELVGRYLTEIKPNGGLNKKCGVIEYGATDYNELCDKLIAAKRKYDVKAFALYKEYITGIQCDKYIKEHNMKIAINKTCRTIETGDRIYFEISARFLDKDTVKKYVAAKRAGQSLDAFAFTTLYGYLDRAKLNDYEVEAYKKHCEKRYITCSGWIGELGGERTGNETIKVADVYVPSEHKNELCIIDEPRLDRFKAGDVVVICTDEYLSKLGRIEKLYDLDGISDAYIGGMFTWYVATVYKPLEIADYAIKKPEQIQIIDYLGDCKGEFNNNFEPEGNFREKTLFVVKSKKRNGLNVITKKPVYTYRKDDDNHLCAYLDAKNAKCAPNEEIVPVKAIDVIRCVMMEPDTYRGILFADVEDREMRVGDMQRCIDVLNEL